MGDQWTLFPQDWEQAQAGSVLATGPHAFDSDPEISDVDEDDRETLFSSMDVLSPGGHSDAQTLAMMLQEQLDAINEEIRLAKTHHCLALKWLWGKNKLPGGGRRLSCPKIEVLVQLQPRKWLQDIQPQGLVLARGSLSLSCASAGSQKGSLF